MADIKLLCSVENCNKPVYNIRGWCSAHYQKWRAYGDPLVSRKRTRGPCSVEGCEEMRAAQGLCFSHHGRWQRHGDPLKGKSFDRTKSQRFFREVVLLYDGDDCLVWPFSRNKDGYGILSIKQRKFIVSRRVCEEVNGPPPTPKHEAAHSCGNGHLGCVNKRHISWKTAAENALDRISHGKVPRGETHAKSKLTEQQVLQIFSMRGLMSQQKIADQFGVSRGTITAIFLGITWAWLREGQAPASRSLPYQTYLHYISKL